MSEETLSLQPEQQQPNKAGDWLDRLMNAVKHPIFLPCMLVLVGAIALFWPTISRLPTLWGDQDGYYSHGILVPFLSALIIIRWWPTLKQNKVKPFWPALLLMIPIIGLGYISHLVVLRGVTAFLFVGTLIVGVWFVAGGRWMLLLSMPLSYLIFGLPAFERQIELYTQKFQGWNTKIAYKMLSLFGQAQMDGETTIMLDRFNLDVGVPCSGLKLFVAVTAFTVLFIYLGLMIRWDMFRAKLGLPPADEVTPETPSVFGRPGFGKAFASTFWPVGVLLALILPLCLFINSLRIVLIGLVGNQFGNAAGHKFHDYSGYITLVVCFYLLFLVAKGLKWKV